MEKDMNQPDLGLKISELRQQKNITQEKLAEYCEVSTRTIQHTLAPHFVWCSAVSRAAKCSRVLSRVTV
jgi:transcriptional regulator with XRE-family HTH domain